MSPRGSRSINYSASPLLASKTPVWRSKFIVAALALAFVGLGARAAYVQVFGNDFFQRQGEVRFARTLELPANRGRVLDRNGLILATSVVAQSLWAIPEDVDKADPKLKTLAKLLGLPFSELKKKLANEDKTFVWVQRQVDEPLAKEIAALVPAKIFRLALLGKEINQQVNFDPEGDTIPVLYDQYDKLAENFWTGTKDDYARLFELIHPAGKVPAKMSLPRFSQVAFVVQMPHLDLAKEFPEVEAAELQERAQYAKHWLQEYAPEKFIFKLQDTMPDAAKNLSAVQKKALGTLLRYIEASSAMPSGEDLHHFLHGMKESEPISPAELFSAIYLSFLGKPMGPKAGWFLSVLPKDFVEKRLREASS